MATLAASMRHKVTVVGSGNWGSTIAKVVAENTVQHPDLFEPTVTMWVYEEEVTIPTTSPHYKDDSPRKLSQLVNELHENVKYLPEIRLPANVVANPSLEDSVKDATILIFNMPHQFIPRIARQIRGKIVPFARGISCIKGIDVGEQGIRLYSDMIGDELDIYCGALSGANIANEVALEKWCETTVAYDPPAVDGNAPPTTPSPHDCGCCDGGPKLTPLPATYPPLSHQTVKALFHRPAYFHVRMVSDVAAVSLGGALKNIVALAAGFVAGLGWGENAKAAIIRIGLLEVVRFGRLFFADKVARDASFMEESCGVADIITSSIAGRNYRCAKMATEESLKESGMGVGKWVGVVEKRELNGQKLQGTGTAVEVRRFLEERGRVADFPLFGAVYEILQGNAKPQDIPKLVEDKSV